MSRWFALCVPVLLPVLTLGCGQQIRFHGDSIIEVRANSGTASRAILLASELMATPATQPAARPQPLQMVSQRGMTWSQSTGRAGHRASRVREASRVRTELRRADGVMFVVEQVTVQGRPTLLLLSTTSDKPQDRLDFSDAMGAALRQASK